MSRVFMCVVVLIVALMALNTGAETVKTARANQAAALAAIDAAD